MANRTYRYFGGTPLYAFGYGLSYSKFSYSGMKLSSRDLKAGSAIKVEANVKNTGARNGDEVVQIYLTYPKLPGAGQTAHVSLTLNPRDLSYVTDAGERVIAPGSYLLSMGGGQPATEVPVVETRFNITGEAHLPE